MRIEALCTGDELLTGLTTDTNSPYFLGQVFALGEKMVHEVMVPRTDIVAIDVNTPPQLVLENVVATGHSRIPVYEGSSDQIIGVLYVKDLFRRLARGQRDVTVRPFLRPAQFVPETKKVDDLLREMQKDNRGPRRGDRRRDPR